MSYGIKLKEIRKKLGMTQIKMAETLGVTQAMIPHYEKSEVYPTYKIIKIYMRLAKEVKVPLKIEELLRE